MAGGFSDIKNMKYRLEVLQIRHARRNLINQIVIHKLIAAGVEPGVIIKAIREARIETQKVEDGIQKPKQEFKPYSESEPDFIPF